MKIEKKSNKQGKLNKNKWGQEEMVGFIIIVIIVSVILLVLLSFLLRKPDNGNVENYQVESFIQSALQYTSSCENQIEFLSVQDLIVSCQSGNTCLDGQNSCDILNDTMGNLIKNAWKVNNQSAVKGYKLGVVTGNTGIFMIQEGNETRNYVSGLQDFSVSGEDYEISLSVYS
jgi:hypothetical protein